MTETQPTRPGDTRRTGSRSRIANERADRTMVAGAMTKAVRRARRLLPILTVCATTTAFAADDASGPLPVETFARFDDIRAARLSPSGADLAIATTGKSGRTFLAVVSLADAAPPKAVAGFSDADIRSFAWVNDDRLVFNTIDTDAPLNDHCFGPGLYSVKRDGSEFRTLIAEKWRPVWSEHSVLLTEPLTPDHGLLSTLRDGSDDVIVGAYTSTANGEPDAITPKRLNTANGHASSLALGAPPHGDDWVFDAGGRPRAMSSEHDGRVEIFRHELDNDRWTSIGLARDPDVYKCGVAWVAVSDPRLLYENSWNSDVSREAQLYSLPRMLGDPVKDAALLKDAAPVEHAKDMTAPLLLVYGGNDVRVPIEHGRAMRSALRKAGMEPEYVVYDGEGHGFLKLENRVDFYTRMERFLAKNLQ